MQDSMVKNSCNVEGRPVGGSGVCLGLKVRNGFHAGCPGRLAALNRGTQRIMLALIDSGV